MGRAYEVRKEAMQKTAVAKSKLYSMYAKDIYVAAKRGGSNPESNLNLKRFLEKAKADQIPNDIIKRALAKVNSGAQEDYSELRYEGFGPGGATLIVDCLTDNVNRTVSLVRTAFARGKAKLGTSGCVSYLYDFCSVVGVTGLTEEEVLTVIVANNLAVKDLEVENNDIIIYGEPKAIHDIKTAMTKFKKGIKIKIDEIAMIPQEEVTLNNEDLKAFRQLLELIEEIADVQEIYHNVNNI